MSLLLQSCAGKVESEELRAYLHSGNIQSLQARVNESFENIQSMDVALTKARLYQLQGKWVESITAYNEALAILEEYESRAVINMRELGSTLGMFALARGTQGYYAAGYERSLLHTFNAVNYLMLNKIQGAAVELKKMENRQEHWLEESSERIAIAQKNAENFTSAKELTSPSELPASYSMRTVLNKYANHPFANYQDPFSYSLSALVHHQVGDTNYAKVSQKRAMHLNAQAEALFNTLDEPTNSSNVKVLVITTTGLAPALYIERIRLFAPVIGYVMFDIPSYMRPVDPHVHPKILAGDAHIPTVELLRTDALAYQTLWDELRYETSAAIARTITRAGVSTAAVIAAESHESTRDYSFLIGLLSSTLMDISASVFDDNVRNWETLPCTGFLSYTTVKPGTTITCHIGEKTFFAPVPQGKKSVIIILSYISDKYVRFDHVAY